MTSMAPKLILDNTMGAQLLGVLLAAGLYGVTCIQTWYYYGWYSNDKWQLQALVAGCWVFDTIHQALISHTIYIYLVKNFNNPAMLGMLVWSLLAEVLFNGLTALLVQSFYAYRIFRLSGEKVWLTSIVVMLIVAEFVSVVVYVVKSLQLNTFEELATLKHLSMAVNILAAAGDVLIAAILCTMLHISRTGFKKSDTMINRLMVFVVNTGLLTSVCACMSLVSIVVWPNAFIYICFYFMLGRLYSNSLLATLNARKSIRGGNCDSEGFSMTMPSFNSTKGSSRQRNTRERQDQPMNTLTVMVETTHERVGDERLEKLRFTHKLGDRASQTSSDMPFTPEDSPKMSLPHEKEAAHLEVDDEHSQVALVRRFDAV